MRTSVIALCLFGLALAAEDSSSRKSRQILHPLLPVSPHGYSFLDQQHVLSPPVPYVQQAVPSVVLPQPLAVPFPQPSPNPASELLRSALHSTRPQVFNNQQSGASQLEFSPFPQNQQLQFGLSGQARQPQLSLGNQAQGNNVFPQPSGPGYIRDPSNQFDDSTQSGRSGFPQLPSSRFNGDSSFQPLVSPNQESNEGQRFGPGNLLNQNFRTSPQPGPSPQPSSFSQPQQSNDNNGLSPYRPSPRLYGPSRAIIHYPTQQRFGAPGFQANSANAARNGPQQPFASFPGPNDQQRPGASGQGSEQFSSRNLQNTPILSQSGQINHDGSYSYGFQSANGIQSSESGVVNPAGLYRFVQGSYSYTAPDGTPISAQYYADETGFHVQGDHIPSPPPPPANRNFQQPAPGQFQQPAPGQFQQSSQQQGPQPVSVESN